MSAGKSSAGPECSIVITSVNKPLRVALFSDCFHALNGVSTVSNEFVAFAGRHGLPFCCIHSGSVTQSTQEDSVTTIELKRALNIKMDEDLFFDPLLSRFRNNVMRQLEEFQPDLIHITGPGDMGLLGFWISNRMRLPMAASWHTNLHEYAGRRVEGHLRRAPYKFRNRTAAAAERHSLRALTWFYRHAHFSVAPNQEMVDLLLEHTGRPSYLLKHGVDTSRFARRPKTPGGKFRIGWVGRLTPEKNVQAFAALEANLLAAGEQDFELLIVGDGSEREWLRARLKHAIMPGFLKGEALADAFASMDAFVFPSKTDTFGLVVLEAMASGVPAVLSAEAGARIGICDGVEGFRSGDLTDGVLRLMRCAELRQTMSRAAEGFARAQSWDGVFRDLYESYGEALQHPEVRRRLHPEYLSRQLVEQK